MTLSARILIHRGAGFWILLIVLSGIAAAQEPPQKPIYPIDVLAGPEGVIYVADLKLPGVWRIKDGQPEMLIRGPKRFRSPLNAVRCLGLDRDGKLLVGDSASTSVLRIDGQKAEPVHQGRIGIPMAIATAADGSLLVADLDVKRIWRIPADGGKPVEFARVPAPRGLAVDSEGRVWVVCHGPELKVLRLDADGKNPEVIAAGGPFRFPNQIVVNDAGDAFVADGYAKAIWKIPAGGKPEKLVAGAPLNNPVGLSLAGDMLLIADSRAGAVFTVSTSGGELKSVGPAN